MRLCQGFTCKTTWKRQPRTKINKICCICFLNSVFQDHFSSYETDHSVAGRKQENRRKTTCHKQAELGLLCMWPVLIFLFLIQNIHCGYSVLVRTASACTHNVCHVCYNIKQKHKNIKIFMVEFSIFTAETKSLYILHGQVFVMLRKLHTCTIDNLEIT